MSIRPVQRLIKSKPTLEGAGVHLRRAFGFGNTHEFDPFLLLDDFRNDVPEDYLAGFPWHPHRGIETVTYMLHGQVEHEDSLGNGGRIGSGDVQWMSAGSGILHQEMPQRTEGRMAGFQLWINLPRRLKMEVPAYRGLRAQGIPVVRTPEGGLVKVVAGSFQGVEGPVREIPVDPTYLDVALPTDSEFSLPVPSGHTVFAQTIKGDGSFDPRGPREGASPAPIGTLGVAERGL